MTPERWQELKQLVGSALAVTEALRGANEPGVAGSAAVWGGASRSLPALDLAG